MRLHLLGINGPFPESGGATSGYLLEAGSSLLQFDLGCGVLSRITEKVAPESLSAIFLSHWHFDHTADLPVLIYRLEAMKKTLPVYAPADPSSAIRRIVADAPCFSLVDVAPGDTVILDGCTVRVGEARHPVPSVGYRVETEDSAFGYTGDTNTLPSLAGFYHGCSLLLADGLFPEKYWTQEKPHLSAVLAAKLAQDAGVSRLVLTHLNPVYPPILLLREAQAIHPGVILASAGAMMDL